MSDERDERDDLTLRHAPLDIEPDEFRRAGHRLVDRLASFLDTWDGRAVTKGRTPTEIRDLLGDDPLPDAGRDAASLLAEATDLVLEHSLFNGHPRFFGYITSSPAPAGALADLLASTANPNVGSFVLSPVATEIEAQTIRWLGELIGFPAGGGLLVSGGNMANFVGFLAARRAKGGEAIRTKGAHAAGTLRVYASSETHTWLQKAADLFGLGTDAIRWVPVDDGLRMRVDALMDAVAKDRKAGDKPFLVVGTAGSVSTGAVDPLVGIAALCRNEGLWLHVDGAYGGFAAALPDAEPDLKALSLADSVAIDPHKWLYAPIEAGAVLVRDAAVLRDAFSYHPPYYAFGGEEEPTNFYELGPQNSRGFRALKVWLGLRQAGRWGVVRMIKEDCRLAQILHETAAKTPDVEARTLGLSIATFRYAPADVKRGTPEGEETLNRWNQEILTRIQAGGEAFVSNAVVNGSFLLRACVVNFRTTRADVEAIPGLVARIGRDVRAALG